MLISTLNHNLPKLTDNLISNIRKSFDPSRDQLMVIDNGSDKAPLPDSYTDALDENYYFGGGCNILLETFLSSDQDYLLILNNDLIFHGHKFIDRIYDQINKHDLHLYSPSVINAKISQCNWKTMHNWGTNDTRLVKFIDFQCPVISKELAEKIKEFPEELYLGYGLDFYASIIANRNNMNIGVDDGNVVCHLENQTVKQNKLKMDSMEYYHLNSRNMRLFFVQSDMAEEFKELYNYAENYAIQ